MAIAVMRNLDKSKLTKVYPYVRREPRIVKVTDKNVSFEIGTIAFNDNMEIRYNFMGQYSFPPTIVLSPRGDNVNVWISQIDKFGVTFKSSAPTSAYVEFQALSIV
jgi:hypothetical protein